MRVTFLPDTEVRGHPSDFFPGSDWSAHTHLLDADGQVTANVGSFLIRSRSATTLVDLGLGPSADGKLLINLAAEGLDVADVDFVVFTHLHGDHVGWTGAFPRARYLVERAEWDYWQRRPDVETVLQSLTGRIEFLDALPPGLTAVPAPGHTPGHTCFLVTDPGSDERLLILGDLLHTRAQFTEPGWRFRSDVDPDLARRSRADVLGRFSGIAVAACHFAPDPFGR